MKTGSGSFHNMMNGVAVWQKRKPMTQQVYLYWKDWRQFGRDLVCTSEVFHEKV